MNNTQTTSALTSSVPRMSTKEIADLLGLSREHVTDRIIKRVDFPKPIINISRRTRYWRTSDVIQWMKGKNNSDKHRTGAKYGPQCPLPTRDSKC